MHIMFLIKLPFICYTNTIFYGGEDKICQSRCEFVLCIKQKLPPYDVQKKKRLCLSMKKIIRLSILLKKNIRAPMKNPGPPWKSNGCSLTIQRCCFGGLFPLTAQSWPCWRCFNPDKINWNNFLPFLMSECIHLRDSPMQQPVAKWTGKN